MDHRRLVVPRGLVVHVSEGGSGGGGGGAVMAKILNEITSRYAVLVLFRLSKKIEKLLKCKQM